jgi:hypothetical protein
VVRGRAANSEPPGRLLDRDDAQQGGRTVQTRTRRPDLLLLGPRGEAGQGRGAACGLRLRRGQPGPDRQPADQTVCLPAGPGGEALQRIGHGQFVQLLAGVGRSGRRACGRQPDRTLRTDWRTGRRQPADPPSTGRQRTDQESPGVAANALAHGPNQRPRLCHAAGELFRAPRSVLAVERPDIRTNERQLGYPTDDDNDDRASATARDGYVQSSSERAVAAICGERRCPSSYDSASRPTIR